jgi:hypothetical protein
VDINFHLCFFRILFINFFVCFVLGIYLFPLRFIYFDVHYAKGCIFWFSKIPHFYGYSLILCPMGISDFGIWCRTLYFLFLKACFRFSVIYL